MAANTEEQQGRHLDFYWRQELNQKLLTFLSLLFSKPLTYAIALENLGESLVHKYVGQEPSGRNFNELVLDHNSKLHTAFITHSPTLFT